MDKLTKIECQTKRKFGTRQGRFRSVFARALAPLAAVAFAFAPVAAQASRVSPMVLDLEPTVRELIARVELTNDAQRDTAYEVQMMRGDISPEGALALTPADEEFIVFPPQAIVEAQSQQVFRLQYVGEDALDRSQVFYLSIKQIPVAFDEGQNQVQVVINYNVLVNVVPDGAEPVATIRSAAFLERPIELDDPSELDDQSEQDAPAIIPTEKGILIDLGNDGTRYFFAGRSDWSITGTTVVGEPFAQSYTGDEMSGFIGTGVVGPGKNRIFFVPTEVNLDTASLKISIDP